MHANSIYLMKGFIKHYLFDKTNKKLKILDLGSQVVKNQAIGSYRPLFNNSNWQYTGVDIAKGENVDVVIKPYSFPFKNNHFDVVISGQTLEHIEYPWKWIRELARVVKKNGLVCLIAPAVIHEHKYPIDTYRYYPDGMNALAKWANLKVIDVKRVPFDRKLEDTYLIASK